MVIVFIWIKYLTLYLQAIHVHTERINLGKKAVPAKKAAPKQQQQKPVTRAGKPDIKKTSTVSAVVRNRFKKKDEETAISKAILTSELISSSNENQNEAMTSFSSDSMSMFDSSFNDSLTASGKRKSRPVPNIPIDILKDSPVTEMSAVSIYQIESFVVKITLFYCNVSFWPMVTVSSLG